MVLVVYALVGLSLGAAFLATRNWLFVVVAVVLYAGYPLVRRLDRRLRRHDAVVHAADGAWTAACGCGWSSRHAIRAEADRAADLHRRRRA
jgi:hypothetical protein